MPTQLPSPAIKNCDGLVEDPKNADGPKIKCLKLTDLPELCFQCIHANDDAEYPKCKTCSAFTLGCEMVDGVLESICFNCYYLKLSEQFQADVCTGKIKATPNPVEEKNQSVK